MAPSRVLRERVAGQSAMCNVVTAQAVVHRQSAAARIFGISPLTFQARSFYRGALAELLVGDVLENLGQRWDVLHDVPLRSGSLDHLVIGPAGVFAVHTAHCSGVDVAVEGDALVVVGETRDDILVARAEADEASQLLAVAAGRPVVVWPLLVVVDPKRLMVRVPASGVRVIASGDIERMLGTAPHTLSGDDVAFMSDVADLDATWPAAGSTALDTQQLHRDFGLIRARVRSALVRRIAWAAVATGVVYTSVCTVIAALVSMMMTIP